MRITQRRRARARALTGAGLTALIAGCGGTGNSNAARIRTVDAAVNAGTANILVNNASAYGDQQAFGQGKNTISPYLYLGTGSGTSFTYTTNATTPSGVTFNTTTLQLSDNVFYTAYLIGRADVSGVNFLHVLDYYDCILSRWARPSSGCCTPRPTPARSRSRSTAPRRTPLQAGSPTSRRPPRSTARPTWRSARGRCPSRSQARQAARPWFRPPTSPSPPAAPTPWSSPSRPRRRLTPFQRVQD